MRVVVLALSVVACGDAKRSVPEDAARRPPPIVVDAQVAPRYAVRFPAPALARSTTVQTIEGPMSQQVESAELDGTTYLVVSGAMPPGLPANNVPGGQARVLAAFGAQATKDVAIDLAGLPGREVAFTGAASGTLRTFTVGGWMIQAGVVKRGGAPDPARAAQFLDSLRIDR